MWYINEILTKFLSKSLSFRFGFKRTKFIKCVFISRQ